MKAVMMELNERKARGGEQKLLCMTMYLIFSKVFWLFALVVK